MILNLKKREMSLTLLKSLNIWTCLCHSRIFSIYTRAYQTLKQVFYSKYCYSGPTLLVFFLCVALFINRKGWVIEGPSIIFRYCNYDLIDCSKYYKDHEATIKMSTFRNKKKNCHYILDHRATFKIPQANYC